MEKVILRFLDKRLVKGHLERFSPSDHIITIKADDAQRLEVDIEQLKGIFFVKSFGGDSGRKEKKSFEGVPYDGKKVFVRFKDGESMVGYVEGEVPWEKGFFLHAKKNSGFFLRPVDVGSNNTKIFVVAKSIDDVTVIE